LALEIRQTFAKIGIRTTPGRLEIKTRDARLEMRRIQPKLNISSEPARVEIDQYESFASMGLKGVLDFTAEAAYLGKRQVMDYISKKSSDGRRLAAIHRGGNPIADIARRNALQVRRFGLDFIPKARPRITVREGELKIEPETNENGMIKAVEAKYIPGDVEINYIRGKVEIYLRQKASISISYKGEKVDTYL